MEVWKQAFIDWSSSFRTWESCSKEFLKVRFGIFTVKFLNFWTQETLL